MARNIILNSFREAYRCLDEVLADEKYIDELTALAQQIGSTIESGGKILIAGNGGSMADAMHFAEECTGRFKKDRRPYPAMSLSDPTHLSCVANDYGFEHVFSRMVEAFARPGDCLILLSTSGNSKNLILAAESGRKAGAHIAGFLGKGGGSLAPLCDQAIIAPGSTSDRIQEIHMLSLHILVETLEIFMGDAQP